MDFSTIFKEPNWVILLFLGYGITYLPNFFRFVLSFFKKDLVTGTWFGYVFSNETGNMEFVEFSMIIQRSLFHGYLAKIERNKQLRYTGKVRFERNFLLIHLSGKNHAENVYIRVVNPIPSVKPITVGLHLSLDFQGRPFSGAIILSRTQISKEEAVVLFTDKVQQYQAEKAMVVI